MISRNFYEDIAQVAHIQIYLSGANSDSVTKMTNKYILFFFQTVYK